MNVKSAADRPITLRQLAEHLQLSPATISLVLNDAPGANSIAPATRKRVLAAAQKLKYRPNFMARSLRTSQSFTIGVIVPELSEGYFTMVMAGIEHDLHQAGYLHFVVSHQGNTTLLHDYPRLLTERSVEGLILVNTRLTKPVSIPVVSISGVSESRDVVNIALDHDRSAELALRHMYDLGHRNVAFMRGPVHNPDSEARWESIRQQADAIGLPMRKQLCMEITTNSHSPELGYPIVKQLLERTRNVTAIFCFNDVAAIGAIRAIKDAGLRCPEDISVVGFDDIATAAYCTPSLTTIRQPLTRMGETAVQMLLKRMRKPAEMHPGLVMFEPELIVRESSGPAPGKPAPTGSGRRNLSAGTSKTTRVRAT